MSQQLSRHGIGASEIAAVVGLNPHSSPWDVWLAKTGQAPEFEGNTFTEWGNRLEPAIRQAYVDKTQCAVMVPTESLFSKVTPWARATPDGIVIDQKPDAIGAVWQALVQCKNVGTFVEKAWKEAPPAYVQLQTQWEMLVTDLGRADIAVLIGGNDFRIYSVHRDDKLITDLVEIASAFWAKVESRTPPPIDASDACRDHFTRRLARKDAVELVADARIEELFGEWRHVRSRQKICDAREAEIRNTVLAELADAKADRIRSGIGTAKLQKKPEGTSTSTSTNWRLVAELLGSSHPDQFRDLVSANTTTTTTTTPEKLTLYAPAEWKKDAAA